MILEVILASFAVWRLSHAIVKETGPFGIFARFRAYLGTKQKRIGGLFDMVSCVACLSFYVGLVASLWFAQSVFQIFVYSLSFSAFAVLIEAYINSKSKNSDSFSFVTPPTSDDEIFIRTGSTPEKRDNMVSNPNPHDGSPAVKT